MMNQQIHLVYIMMVGLSRQELDSISEAYMRHAKLQTAEMENDM